MDTKNYKSYNDTIMERFSCRSFLPQKITQNELQEVLKARILAPTAVNFQPERIIVVENEALLEKMKEATRFTFDAKTILVVCYDKNVSWHRKSDGKDHGDIDATIVATQMMLEATTLGLGTCFVCSFKEEILRNILDIPENYGVTCMLPIGYPKEVLPHGPRIDIEDIVIYK